MLHIVEGLERMLFQAYVLENVRSLQQYKVNTYVLPQKKNKRHLITPKFSIRFL